MFEEVVVMFASLLGFSALVSVLVNLLKFVKIKGVPLIQDGKADVWVAGFNMVGILALYAVRIFLPGWDPLPIDSALSEIAKVATFVFSFVSMVLGSKLTYVAFRKLPVLGKSNSA